MTGQLYLDTEFNGHGGELLSLAIADPKGTHWYGVLQHDPASLHPWVAEHVEPLFDMVPVRMRPAHLQKSQQFGGMRFELPYFRESLMNYLNPRQGSTVIADWPADFVHLLNLFIGPSYDQAWVPHLSFLLIRTPAGEPQPEVPHNALSDAIALMEFCEGQRL